ncbi:hypothetical protein RND81_08G026300 [Saponaria officinalis]|uniref:MAR-binding filament-like protein 1-1 n=1 Tax=Saponaria officinalis TaxID=3572 RepID=A0AAW1J359_SAPOF
MMMISGVAHFDASSSIVCFTAPTLPLVPPISSTVGSNCKIWNKNEVGALRKISSKKSMRAGVLIPKCSGSSSSSDTTDESPSETKASFGYTRKDVILIGVGVTAFGVSLKSGLEYVGVDPLQAGNVVQLVIVLGMTVGWILTYLFRVASKDMTYAQQLRDYESKVMEKRLEGLTEAELQVLLEQVEEEKRAKTKRQAS